MSKSKTVHLMADPREDILKDALEECLAKFFETLFILRSQIVRYEFFEDYLQVPEKFLERLPYQL